MTRSVPTYLSKSILPISVFPIISNSVFPFLPSSSQLRDSSLLSRQLDTLPFLKCHFGYFFSTKIFLAKCSHGSGYCWRWSLVPQLRPAGGTNRTTTTCTTAAMGSPWNENGSATGYRIVR